MDDWRFQFPSSIVTRKFKGDREFAHKFVADAEILLYHVKNDMKFNELGQSRANKFYDNGATIEARSIFGNDFITIDVSRVTGVITTTCTITLLDLPTIIQPMANPGEITESEVEGIDYIKTYYTVDFSSCAGCSLKWNLLPNLIGGLIGSILDAEAPLSNSEAYKLYNPFIFHNDAYELWYDAEEWRRRDYPDADPRPDDHCIHSYWSNCAAEIIEAGRDSKGRYIIWKAYTEYTYNYPYLAFAGIMSKTGLGYMEIMPYSGKRVINADGTVEFSKENCKDTSIITVDCCHKEAAHRPVQMWWEEATLPFAWIYGTKYYKVPDTTTVSVLAYYAYHWGGGLYVFPEFFGACVPLEWTLSGFGTLTVSETYGQGAWWMYPDGWRENPSCDQPVVITVRDRCGSEDTVTALPCCPGGPLSIGFTSLYMTAGYTQALYVSGGCWPFTWTIVDGGGSIVSDGLRTGLYYAPDDNPGCLLNPTIRVTDCCGETAEVELAVGKNLDGIALRYFSWNPVDCHLEGDHLWHFSDGAWARGNYNCDGTTQCYGAGTIGTEGTCNPGPEVCCEGQCYDDQMRSYDSGCGDYYGGGACMGTLLMDTRQDWMRDGGCCPINPFTGLPFD